MAKVYIVNDADLVSLLERLELTKLRSMEFLGSHDAKRFQIDDMHRSFHLHVSLWIDGIKK